MFHLEQLHGWHVAGSSLYLDCHFQKLRLTPVLPGVVQVRLIRMDWYDQEDAGSWAVIPAVLRASGLDAEAAPAGLEEGDEPAEPIPPVPAIQVTETADELHCAMGEVMVRVSRSPVRLTFCDPSGAPRLREAGGAGWDQWRVACEFAAAPEDRFYGLGEFGQHGHEVRLELSGRRYPIHHLHAPGPARLTVPVLLSLRGYGVMVDNPWTGELDLTGTTAGQGGRWRYAAEGGVLTYYYLAGPDLPGVLDRLTRLTGRPSLPPLWSFGLLQSRFGYRTRDEVEELARTFRTQGIPCDGIVLDLYWFKVMGDLKFDEDAFPRPAEMISRLKQDGFRLIVIEEPFLIEGSRLQPEAIQQGVVGQRPAARGGGAYRFPIFAGPNAALVDFSNPAARSWWAREHHALTGLGIDGWWCDLNEPEVHPPDMIHHGGPAQAVHNLQALQMVAAVYRGQREVEPDRRLFIMSRSGWIGTQRYGAGQWSGDVLTTWDALADQPVLGLSMGLIGFANWNTDIGGFQFDPPSPELYLRWLQFGIFTPVCRPHGAQQPREPWAFGPEAEAGARVALELRYRLLPYTYTLAAAAYRTGLPLMRPLLLHHPADPAVWDLADQFLWGRDLLVAPVLAAGQTERSVYLPDGTWYDYWTGQTHTGGRQVSVAAPLDRIPLFVRAGALLPMAPGLTRTGRLPWDPLTVRLYPDGAESWFDLYEDDGATYGYRRGEYLQTRLTCRPVGDAVEVAADAQTVGMDQLCPARQWGLEVHRDEAPRRVSHLAGGGAGHDLPAVSDAAALEGGAGGWWYDARQRLVMIKLPGRSEGFRVQVE